jgi:alkaline phosphatase
MKTLAKQVTKTVTFLIVIAALMLGPGLSTLPLVEAKSPPVKNVIIMISDGWDYNHLSAASYYVYGKDARQVYNRFPVNYAMSTYMGYTDSNHPCFGWGYDPDGAWSSFDYVKNCATDSAAAATSMSTGAKTYGGAIGVGLDGAPLWHALDQAELLGKSTGVVTSVEFSHATPAGFVAHNPARGNYAEIANEMIYDSAVDVIMGAGHPWYNRSGELRTTPNTFKYVGGEATWNDLVAGTAGGDADGDASDDPWTLIQTRAEFQNLMSGQTPDRVIGVPQVYQTLQQGRGGDGYADPYVVPLIQTVPTLEEMTVAALNILDDDPDGLFLVVEGGAVDWASHANQSGRMIEEQIDFDNAVQAVDDWVRANSNWGETLLIVTGDHECGYLTGPGSDPTWEPIVNNGVGNLPGMEWHSGSHTNSLIVVSAKGDAARLLRPLADESDPVHGRYLDNTEIAQVVFEALGAQ